MDFPAYKSNGRIAKLCGLPNPAQGDTALIQKLPYMEAIEKKQSTLCPMKLNLWLDSDGEMPTDLRRFAVLDLETTGFDPEAEEIIEVGALFGCYSPSRQRIVNLNGLMHGFNEPSKPIPEEVVEHTGITDEEVKGHQLPVEKFHKVLARNDFTICHNAGFDAKFVSRVCPDNKIRFGCSSMGDVNWKDLGYFNSALESILFQQGFVYKAHRATIDVLATVMALVEEPLAFERILRAVSRDTYFVQAFDSPYGVKDILSDLDFSWMRDGKTKVWSAFFSSEEEVHAALSKLDKFYNASGTAQIDRITPEQRYK
ncbi:exonuclease domain-containing protein [Idiomarina abyssalis]|uniref:Exonuclease domain-containing protein n=1 Tax=Idiomarina abyssalis TaxID=86102 RepID=A0A8I1KFC5_9GAMM|nr:exonuclease domain-containing protein [Idiomarina abyssalis]MBJ7265495.1 hypothetical protein [Idiomarina abyssalis]MBJ7316831.1 hypothetical protein [Idiomarina abyssalis]